MFIRMCGCVPYPHGIPSNQPTKHFAAEMLPISLEVDLAWHAWRRGDLIDREHTLN